MVHGGVTCPPLTPNSRNVLFENNQKLLFGTCEDWSLGFDGCNLALTRCDCGSGSLVIDVHSTGVLIHDNTACPPSSPDTVLHLWAGSGGACLSAANDTILAIENDAATKLEFLTPGSEFATIAFSDACGADRGVLAYDHNTDRFDVRVANNLNFRLLDGELQAQKAYKFSSTGCTDLTVSPGRDLVIPSVSQNCPPTLTTNGAIQIWEDANACGTKGRLLVKVNCTTYTFNADS